MPAVPFPAPKRIDPSQLFSSSAIMTVMLANGETTEGL
jgi:hypothetical protein